MRRGEKRNRNEQSRGGERKNTGQGGFLYRVFLALGGDGHGPVGDLVVGVLVGLYDNGGQATPALPLDDGLQAPALVGGVREAQALSVRATYRARENHLLEKEKGRRERERIRGIKRRY